MSLRIGIGKNLRITPELFNWQAYWTTRFPDTLTITIDSDTQITLNWVNNGVADYDDIRIYQSTDGVTYTEIDDVALGTTIYSDGGLSPETYFYKVRYKNGSHYSAYSNVITVTETDFFVTIGSIITEADEAFIMESNEYIIQE